MDYVHLKKIWKLFDSIQHGIAVRFDNIVLLSGELENKSDIRVYEKAIEQLKLMPIVKETKHGKKILIMHKFSKKILDNLGIKE